MRYITTQPSLTKTSIYGRTEVSYTEGGAPSYEAGVAAGGPLIDGTLGARAIGVVPARWRLDRPTSIRRRRPAERGRRRTPTTTRRTWCASRRCGRRTTSGQSRRASTTRTASAQRYRHLLAAVLEPRQRQFRQRRIPTARRPRQVLSARAQDRGRPGRLPADLEHLLLPPPGADRLRRHPLQPRVLPDLSACAGTRRAPDCRCPAGVPFPLLDGNGIHLPAGTADYRSPATIDNGQQNITQEIRLQSSDPNAKLVWTTGVFFSDNRQSYLEQIHDPMLNELFGRRSRACPTPTSSPTINGNPVPYVAASPTTRTSCRPTPRTSRSPCSAKAPTRFTDNSKLTVGARYSHTKYSFNTLHRRTAAVHAPTAGTRRQEGKLLHAQGRACSSRPIRTICTTPPTPRAFVRAAPTIRCRQAACAAGFPRLRHQRIAGHLQLGHGQQLRDRRQEQHRQSHPHRQQHLLHQVEQHPADRRAADLPDLLHRQSRQGGRQGHRHAGGYFCDRHTYPGTCRRLHRCTLTRRTPIFSPSEVEPDRVQRRRHRRPEQEAGGGQPTAPVHRSLGLEYRFSALRTRPSCGPTRVRGARQVADRRAGPEHAAVRRGELHAARHGVHERAWPAWMSASGRSRPSSITCEHPRA